MGICTLVCNPSPTDKVPGSSGRNWAAHRRSLIYTGHVMEGGNGLPSYREDKHLQLSTCNNNEIVYIKKKILP